MKYHLPSTKPESIGYRGWIKVLGLNWGLFPGWHIAHWNEKKNAWYHHSTCRVSCVVLWREIPNPNDQYKQ